MTNTIFIPSHVMDVMGNVISQHKLQPDLIPLVFSCICLQEIYIQLIVNGINDIDERMATVIKDSIKIEFKKLLIEINDIQIRENYECLRYKRPTLRFLRISNPYDNLIEKINTILTEENGITYLKIRQMLLTNKTGIHLELDLLTFDTYKKVKDKLEFIILESTSLPVKHLVSNASFQEGVVFNEVNPFLELHPRMNTLNITCLTPDRKVESFFLLETLNYAIEQLGFALKKNDATVHLDEDVNLLQGLQISQVFNIEYGQKLYVTTEISK